MRLRDVVVSTLNLCMVGPGTGVAVVPPRELLTRLLASAAPSA
jgi:sulfite reductase alpha subunit-like flavoprotein